MDAEEQREESDVVQRLTIEGTTAYFSARRVTSSGPSKHACFGSGDAEAAHDTSFFWEEETGRQARC
jgi:hypothetical protein